jgi:hypothetical protein
LRELLNELSVKHRDLSPFPRRRESRASGLSCKRSGFPPARE